MLEVVHHSAVGETPCVRRSNSSAIRPPRPDFAPSEALPQSLVITHHNKRSSLAGIKMTRDEVDGGASLPDALPTHLSTLSNPRPQPAASAPRQPPHRQGPSCRRFEGPIG